MTLKRPLVVLAALAVSSSACAPRAVAPPPEPASAAASVAATELPVLLPRAVLEANNLIAELVEGQPRTPHRPIGEFFTLVVPGAEEARFDQQLAAATEALLARPLPRLRDRGDGVFQLEAHDEPAVAHYLLARGWTGLHLREDVVLLNTGRRGLWIAAETNAARMLELAHAAIPSRGRWVVLRASGQNLVPYRPSFGPAFSEYEELYWASVLDARKAQMKALTMYQASRRNDDRQARAEDGILVELTVEQVGALTSSRTFILAGEVEHTVLMPRADRVALLDGADPELRSLGVVPWARFAEVMGRALEPTGLWPEMVLLKRSPTPAEVARLLAAERLPHKFD